MDKFIKFTAVGICFCYKNKYCFTLSGECEYGAMNRIWDHCAGPEDTRGYRILSVEEYLLSLNEKEREITKREIDKFIKENS
jgi:hypothetical protein